MAGIFYLILKIIGIILLAALAILLLIALFPVTYRIEASKSDNSFYFRIRIKWLLGVFYSNTIFSKDKSDSYVKLFGFRIIGKKKKRETANDEVGQFEKRNPKVETKAITNSKTKVDDDFIDEAIFGSQDESKTKKSDGNSTKNEQDESDKELEDFIDKIFIFIDNLKKSLFKMKSIFGKIVNKVRDLYKQTKNTFKSVSDFLEYVRRDEVKEALKYAKEKVIVILKHIKPRSVKGQVHFGFDSPDKTGKSLGVLGTVCGMFDIDLSKFQVEPDFKKKCIDGNIQIKGYFLIGVLVAQLSLIYANKDLKKIIDSFLKK